MIACIHDVKAYFKTASSECFGCYDDFITFSKQFLPVNYDGSQLYFKKYSMKKYICLRLEYAVMKFH